MEEQQKLEPWQIRIINKRRRLEQDREKVLKLEEDKGKEEAAERLLKDLRRTSRSITRMLKRQPKNLPVDRRDCLTDFQRCVDDLTAYSKETQSMLTEYITTFDKTPRFDTQAMAIRATIVGGSFATAAYLSNKVCQMNDLSPQWELIITSSASVLIIAGFAAKKSMGNVKKEDLAKAAANDSSPETKEEKAERKPPTHRIKPPGVNL